MMQGDHVVAITRLPVVGGEGGYRTAPSPREGLTPEVLAALAGLRASPADGVTEAVAAIAAAQDEVPPVVLIGGSLYLAGRVLEANGTVVD